MALQEVTSGGQIKTAPLPTAPAAVAFKKASITDVVNTTVATDILGGAGILPALGITSILKASIVGDYLNNSGAGSAMTLEVKLGATTIWKDTQPPTNTFASANRRPWTLDLQIANIGATNSQQMQGVLWVGSDVLPTNGIGTWVTTFGWAGLTNKVQAAPIGGTSAEDTSSAKTLTINVTHGVAAATISWRVASALGLIF